MKQEKIQRKKDELDKKECKRLYFKTLMEIKKDIGICEVPKKEKLQLKSWNKPPPMMKMSSLLTKRKHSSRVRTAFPKMFSNHILKYNNGYLLRIMKTIFRVLTYIDSPVSSKALFRIISEIVIRETTLDLEKEL